MRDELVRGQLSVVGGRLSAVRLVVLPGVTPFFFPGHRA